MKRRPFIETSIVLFCLLALAAQSSPAAPHPLVATPPAQSVDLKQTGSYRRIKAHLDATPAIDTHDHIPPFGFCATTPWNFSRGSRSGSGSTRAR